MFKNVLVISDNIILAGEFEKIIQNHQFNNSSFTFGISPFSLKADFDQTLASPVDTIDLRNPLDVERIIHRHDLVFSIHCKQIFPEQLINAVKCINVHPGYNPINRGWYPQVFAIIEGLPIGATIHEIDNKLDHGNIIAREFVPKYTYDTSIDVYNRVVKKEVELLNIYLKNIIENKYETFKPEREGKVFLKKDFNKLLHIDLKEKGTFKNFIDRLRALTHGNYKNAYFVDPESGKKIYINLYLYPENEE